MFFINLVVATFVAFGLNSGYARTAMAALLSTAVTLAYYAFLESSRGQTVGKMVVGLKVQNLAGQDPTMEQALKRNVYIALGFLTIIPILGFLGSLAQLAAVIYIAVTINSDRPLFRGWHDKFADTQDGERGVEENPKRHGGSTGRRSPRGMPSSIPRIDVTACMSRAP